MSYICTYVYYIRSMAYENTGRNEYIEESHCTRQFFTWTGLIFRTKPIHL